MPCAKAELYSGRAEGERIKIKGMTIMAMEMIL